MDRSPSKTITEAIIDAVDGRRVIAALFTTYEFDPAFFEQEIVSALMDLTLSHSPRVRLAQLEESLRSMPRRVAVFYDRKGLIAGETGSRRLDIDCQCVGGDGGMFHPKLALLLVESAQGIDGTSPVPSLVVMVGSCNLTRSGWWRNLEVAHVEELHAETPSELGPPLLRMLKLIDRRRIGSSTCESLEAIRSFLRKVPARLRRSAGGTLLTQLYVSGQQSVPDFLAEATGGALRGMQLEVLSSSFDASGLAPLAELSSRFSLRAVRVHLPMAAPGTTELGEATYQAMTSIPGAQWGALPKSVLSAGRTEGTQPRFMHAKVYRFFTVHPKREILFIGSVNLTTAAHHGRRNVECGVLIEVETPRRPEPWLEPAKATVMPAPLSDDPIALTSSPLMLAHDWSTGQCHAYWDAKSDMPPIRLTRSGLEVGDLPAMAGRTWVAVAPELAGAIADQLRVSSLLTASEPDGASGVLLVQESGMELKPSLMLSLSAIEIMKVWTMLSAEARAEFLQRHGRDLSLWGLEDEIVQAVAAAREETLFDRFAGIFTAFDALEQRIHAALDAGHDREAAALLLGTKHDSLGRVLAKLDEPSLGSELPPQELDPIHAYVIVLCATQVLDSINSRHPEFLARHATRTEALRRQIAHHSARGRVQSLAASRQEPVDGFLPWFERAFLTKALRVERVP